VDWPLLQSIDPLGFSGEVQLIQGQFFGLRVAPMPDDEPELQSIASAAVWRENLDRTVSWGRPTVSYVYVRTVLVDEPNVGWGPVLLCVVSGCRNDDAGSS
jgi:hypothetical protein